MSQSWQMPAVEPGTIVRWHPGGGTDWVPAVVSKLNGTPGHSRHVVVNIIQSNLLNFQVRDAVRHVDDPDVREDEKSDSGTWSYTDQHKRLLAMEKVIKDLTGSPAKK